MLARLLVIAFYFCCSSSFGFCGGANASLDWWEHANFYQIYPRSFLDTDGDGVGDLNGVLQKLDYVRDIGMDGVWLSPIFQSPMYDFGYDISDYTKINPIYGTMDDLLAVIQRAHELGLHLILDFVPNHTSDEHEWFKRSVARDPYYCDFYIWHDGVLDAQTGERRPPSNWLSEFRYSAWEWNEHRQQYYLHQFGVKQPDLNYRNPNVVEALNDVLRFWLALSIDGFRIDAMPYLYEAEIDPATGTYPDEPVIANVTSCPDVNDYCHLQHIYTSELPETLDIIYQWRALVDQWTRDYQTDQKVLLAEDYASFDFVMRVYGDGVRKGAHVPFNFEMFGLNNGSTASDYDYYVRHWLDNMPAGVQANWVMGNHDNPRLASRFGVQRVDLLNIYLQTLPGIVVTYMGEEYGMENGYVSWEDNVDPQGCSADPNTYATHTRDFERTPMQWNNTKNAGFSSANRTWLPVGQTYQTVNVQAQLDAQNSHLRIFKQLTALRKSEPAFINGTYESKIVGDVLLYKRTADVGKSFLVALNLSDKAVTVNVTDAFGDSGDKAEYVITSLQSGISSRASVNLEVLGIGVNVGYVLSLEDSSAEVFV